MLMRDKYFFLSNFYPCTIPVDIGDKHLIFSSIEAAFQAYKNYDLAEKFVLLTPYEAKKYGKIIPLTTPNWDEVRYEVMAKVLYIKFSDKSLLERLQKVSEPIVEDNFWRDTFWGVYKGAGKNILGKLLTNIKENNNDYTKLMEYANQLKSDN